MPGGRVTVFAPVFFEFARQCVLVLGTEPISLRARAIRFAPGDQPYLSIEFHKNASCSDPISSTTSTFPNTPDWAEAKLTVASPPANALSAWVALGVSDFSGSAGADFDELLVVPENWIFGDGFEREDPTPCRWSSFVP